MSNIERSMWIALFLALGTIIATLALGCSSFQTIGYQSAAALQLDNTLYRDVHTLTGSKAAIRSAYDPVPYATIDADITNCERLYGTITKSGLSLDQLGHLRHATSIYRGADSAGASLTFFQINGPQLDSMASAIVETEQTKLIH